MSDSFTLPLGLVQGGTVVRDVCLKPMTAGVRRSIVTRQNMRNPAQGITVLLGQCVESIGSIPVTPQVLNSMVIGDRDFMLMMLRKISIGDLMPGQMVCPKCQTPIAFDIPIDDVKINVLEEGKDFKVDGGFPIVELESADLKIKTVLRYPVGHDQVALADKLKLDPATANYELMSRLIRSWEKNGEPVKTPNTLQFIDSLSIKEVEWLEEAYKEKQPGPMWDLHITCGACGDDIPVDVGNMDFLFKTRR